MQDAPYDHRNSLLAVGLLTLHRAGEPVALDRLLDDDQHPGGVIVGLITVALALLDDHPDGDGALARVGLDAARALYGAGGRHG